MNQTLLKRLRIAAYFILLLSAAVLYYASWTHELGSIEQNILLNIASGLITAVVVFLVLSLFFADNQLELNDRLTQIERLLGENRQISTDSDPEEQLLEFDRRIADAQSLDLLGYSMAHLLASSKHSIASALTNGLKMRVVLLDPTTTAGDLMSQKVGTSDLVREPHDRSVRYLSEIKEIASGKSIIRGSLDIKLIPWVPSVYLNILDGGQDKGVAIAGVNALTISNSNPRRLHYRLEKTRNPIEFGFYLDNFNEIWQADDSATLEI